MGVQKNDQWQFEAYQTVPASEQLEHDFLTMASTLAALSTHPAAASIDFVARANQCSHAPVIGFQDFPEEGFGGAVHLPGEPNPRAVLIGTRPFIEISGLQLPAPLEVAYRRWAKEGSSLLLGGWDGYVRGVMKFTVGDQ